MLFCVIVRYTKFKRTWIRVFSRYSYISCISLVSAASLYFCFRSLKVKLSPYEVNIYINNTAIKLN